MMNIEHERTTAKKTSAEEKNYFASGQGEVDEVDEKRASESYKVIFRTSFCCCLDYLKYCVVSVFIAVQHEIFTEHKYLWQTI